jgi:hypothetical protein
MAATRAPASPAALAPVIREPIPAVQTRMLLLLPLPIPLTNTLPALTVVLLAVGAMERDGLFYIAGCATFTVTFAYFGLLAFGGAHLLDNLRHTVFGV